MKRNGKFTNYTDERITEVLFFLFGFAVMAWVPRLPEIKDNLQLNNGQFGTIISLGGIGGLISLLTIGHVVHHVGSGKVIRFGFVLLFLTFSIIPHLRNAFLFLIVNILIGFGISMVHLSLNAQAFADQESLGRPIISKMHGMWSLGALSTAILSSFLIDRFNLTSHLLLLEGTVLFLAFLLLQLRNETLLKSKRHKDSRFSISGIFTSFRIDYLVSAGLLCAVILEFTIGDWSSIFARDSIGIKNGLNALPYIFYTIAMILGRLNANRIYQKFTIVKAVQIFGAFGGIGFTVGIIISNLIYSSNRDLAFTVILIGFTIGGFGASIMGPTFTNAAIERSNLPSSVVVGQLGFINTFAVWVMKTLVAWTAQLSSLFVALILPALMLAGIGLFSKATKPVQSKS